MYLELLFAFKAEVVGSYLEFHSVLKQCFFDHNIQLISLHLITVEIFLKLAIGLALRIMDQQKCC